MKNVIKSLILILIAAIPYTLYSQNEPGVQFLRKGPLNEADLPKNLNNWLGFFIENGNSELIPVSIKTKEVIVKQGDGGHIEIPAISISGTSKIKKNAPFFMIKGDKIKKGKLKNSWSLKWDEIWVGKNKIFSIGKNKYEIECRGDQVSEYEFKNYKVVLKHKNKEQVIYDRDYVNENSIPYIDWVGDIDRDGKLDLLLIQHPIYESNALFLSSIADDKIVGMAAKWVPVMEGFFPH